MSQSRTAPATLVRMLTLLLIALATPGCEAIGRIFEAGVWVGVLGVVIVLAVVGYLVSRVRRP